MQWKTNRTYFDEIAQLQMKISSWIHLLREKREIYREKREEERGLKREILREKREI